MRTLLLAAGLVALPIHTSAWAQNCTRGCRCGNACIDCSDTCHVGGGGGDDGGGNVDAGALGTILLVGLGLTALGLGIYAIGEYAARALDAPPVDVQVDEHGGALLLRGEW